MGRFHIDSAKFAALLIAILLATPAAWAQSAGASSRSGNLEPVIGSGRLQTEQRSISGFRAVDLQGSMNLVLRQGSREAVEVLAEDNLLPLIDTRVVAHAGVPTLEISVRPGTSFSSRKPIVVTVDFIGLSSLALSGSGDAAGASLKGDVLTVLLTGSGNLQIGQLDVGRLSARLNGSGDAELRGRAAQAEVKVAGSGGFNGIGLQVDIMILQSTGSGGAQVNARKTLALTIAGSGDVTYVGEAKLEQTISGSGRAARR